LLLSERSVYERRVKRARLAVSLAALCSIVLATRTGAQEGEKPRDGVKKVEEIVVTARRREELLEDTPVSVTALDETTLRDTGIVRLDQVQNLAPNLTFLTGRSGLAAAVFIRGVGQVDPILTFDPGVGIYVDGVYLARQAGAVLDVLDVEQVEVLRGPQGTLFGKNTVGGAINITTVKPRDELEGFSLLRVGTFDTVQTKAMVNVPVRVGGLEDKLFTRFSFASVNTQGYTKNVLDGTYHSDTNSLSFLGAIRYLPVDDVELILKGTWFRDHNGNKGGRCVFVQDPPLGALVNPGFADACKRSEPFYFEADTDPLSDIETYGIWGIGTWDVGEIGPIESLQIKSITAWLEQIPRIREDGDTTGFLELSLLDLGGKGDPTQVPGLGPVGELTGGAGFQQQISQEVQANAVALDGDLAWVSGFYALWEDASADQAIVSLTSVPAFAASTGAISEAFTSVDNWSWAIYGQATYDLLDWLALTAGVRYTEEKKGFSKLQVNPSADPDFNPDAPPVNPILVDADESAIFTAWTPMASIAARAPDSLVETIGLDHLLGYFTYSQGFKGGGFNGNTRSGVPSQLVPFEPETLDSFEIGAKTIGWEQRITFNVSLFYGLYDDIQVSQIEAADAGILPELVVRNAAKATTKGAEFELQALPVDGLAITGSIGLLDARYDDFSSPSALGPGEIDRDGETFNNVPRFQSRLTVQYSFQVPDFGPGWLQGWLTPRLDWFYRSEVHYQPPELLQAFQQGYNLLQARLSYDFADDRSQFALWVENLTDQEYFEQTLPTASTLGTITRYYGAPRTVGVELSYRF
jgi:iron complex outermembrane receptor protein